MNILVIEDCTDLLDSYFEFLSSIGHRVFASTNGLDALKLILDNPELDLIISDYNMPYMNGGDLIEYLNHKGIPYP